jgi:hypothetical protein
MQQNLDHINEKDESQSTGSVLREVGVSVKDLIQSEIMLAKAEIKDSISVFSKHASQVGIFGALAAISVLPFLAFLVIGLGNVLDGRYWLSSLLVSIFCASVGGALAFQAYKKIKREDFSLPRTRHSIDREKHLVSDRVQDIKETSSSIRRAS